MARAPKPENPTADLNAISAAHAVAEFTMDGIILSANENFLNALGYSFEEIEGRHHSILVEPKQRNSPEYRNFWAKMRKGIFDTAEYKRIGRNGKEAWFQASYTPVTDNYGQVYKIVKMATDITELKRRAEENVSHTEAIQKSHAVVEFALDGTIITANKKFLDAVGYVLPEITGRHHSMFIEPGAEKSPSYQLFWARLRKGQFQSGTYLRLGNHGRKRWFQSTYNPILDSNGKPHKIVKIATDITDRKTAADEHLGTIDAFHNVQGIAEFTLDGQFIEANDNFLAALGYTLSELQGKPHSMIVPAEDRSTQAYRQFWVGLAGGHHQTAEFRRIGKDGQTVWLRASYTPVLDNSGKAIKIIKFATDITEQKLAGLDQSQQLQAISKAQAVIEFALDGTILKANEKFLALFGYTLPEIQGRHHLILVHPHERGTESFRDFWALLQRGEHQSAECRRVGKGGQDIWLQASYNPIMDAAGRPARIVKVATDITAQKQTTADFLGQTAALHRSHMVIEFAMDGTILTANQNFLDRCGFTLDEVQGQHHGILLDHTARNGAEFKTFWEKLRNGEHQAGEYLRACKDGSELWIRASYNAILDINGNPARVVVFATDITAERAASADHLAQIAAIHRTHGVVECRMDGTIMTANEAYLDMSGYAMADLLGQSNIKVIPPDEQSLAAHRTLWANLNQGQFQAGEFRRRRKDGSEFWIRAAYNPILDSHGKPIKVFAFGTDMTKEKLTATAAEHDALTGLPNRLLMNDRITQAITLARRRHARLAVLFLDLDGFKQVNDTCGHAIGDKLLQEVANRLTEKLRRSDTVSRQGGDEFLILLPDLRIPEDASLIAGNLLAEISHPYTIEGQVLSITTSIGIATYPEDATQTEQLIALADVAMYQAKETGRNAYKFFQSSVNLQAEQRRASESKLRHAVDRNEFSLHFQPTVNIATGSIVGVEALPRWTSPELGLIAPSRFLSITEDTALIAQIGAWTLRAACEQAQAWVDAGAPPLRLNVQIPSMQFHHHGFTDLVDSVLAETRLAPSTLELEIAKSDLLKSPDLAVKILQQLREIGIMIAIDDLATGVSGLGFLCRLPIRALKINDTFVRSHAPPESAARIIRSVIAMAHGLNWEVIAEGVETQEELDFLRGHDCDDARGLYLGRPVPAEKFASQRAAVSLSNGLFHAAAANAITDLTTTSNEWPH
jgi:methyl-accepting chemotaxis protein